MFDSHCHLTDERFADDVDPVIQRARDAGLVGITTVASTAADARAALELAARYPDVHATAGIHPHAAESNGDDMEEVQEIVRDAVVVAVGETGLDYYYDNAPRDLQRELFAQHLQLAEETGLPVIVHSRSADEDTAAMIRGSRAHGVLHCFAGGSDLLDTALDAGWMVSFAGMITFRNFDGADLLRAVPADRLLLETDSPYLAPVPHRGRRNEPAFVVATCAAAASVRGVDTAELGAVTTANARRFYRLNAVPTGA